ncbi:DUF4427 domain-containing protein [Pseudomonas jessenii]|uniref:Uncharacterized protein DUF4427 n=1 Tax=Pseudomonas jessenii TaxID=77298 RepID=A0A370S948_PSEJE|nr:DUF4427 domain-containing protein [Pseudomonas jessenii]RDL16214.1 uncharacterized protein DUF4427 [Pseudomonas jessenii]
MPKKIDLRTVPRVAHYFRDVDLAGKSHPEFVPEAFPSNCWNDDEQWPAGFLLRVAVRFHHLWATFGIRNGERTIHGSKPAVCFSNFSLADLIAVRDGFRPQNEAATQYALTFPVKIAEKGGIQPIAHWFDGRAYLQVGTPLELKGHENVQHHFRFVDAGYNLSNQSSGCSEWRWPYPGSYQRCIAKIEERGFEGSTIPGLKLIWKKWSGIGVVVPDMAAARKLQYDILVLIDRGVVSATHFDHILVCDKLPPSIEGFGEEEIRETVSRACFDFRSCMAVSTLTAYVSSLDFSTRVLILESSSPRKPAMEKGGCWLWFEDNTHPYVRALIKAGRVKASKMGRYLASLDELDPHRDLRERQEIARELSEQLREKFGIGSTYFSVLNSQCIDDQPIYCGKFWGGGYYITASPDDEEE